jgi:hypothetical protein
MKTTTQQKKPRISPGPHYVYIPIGTDGSLISQPEYWRYAAADRCPSGCRVECFRLVRTDVKKVKGWNNKQMAKLKP